MNVKLEIGTVIYGTHRHFGMERRVIDRVTPTTAIVRVNEHSEIKFAREVKDGASFAAKGVTDRWDSTSYSVETPELAERYRVYVLRKRFRKIDADDLTEVQLGRILAIVSEAKNS